MVTIKNQIRPGIPARGNKPYRQIHPHSTGNPSSTVQNEADYMGRKDLSSGYFTHVVGNGQIIQTAPVNQGAWDVGGAWNNETYAAVELIESHKTQAEFDRDYKIYVDLLRSLAQEGGITLKVDEGPQGINTHYYCTYNQPNNKSDHVDPYPYLQKWGISKSQFKKDVENGTSAQNGWLKSGNYWFYYVNGMAVRNGWKQIDKAWYLFDVNGAMYANSWRKVNGKWYFLQSNGATKTGGWQIINGRYYNFDSSGAMKEGWIKEGKTWYYLDSSGAMKTGWFKDKAGNWYYLSTPSGAMVTGTAAIDGKTYTFDTSGKCTNP